MALSASAEEQLLLARLRQLVPPASAAEQPVERTSSLLFHASCDVLQKVRLRVDGLAPGWRAALSRSLRGGNGNRLGPAALRVRATLSGFFGDGGGEGEGEGSGQELCPAAETEPVDAGEDGDDGGISFAAAGALLTFPVAYGDLPSDAAVSLELQLISASSSAPPPSAGGDDSLRAVTVAAGRQRLFSRHGALKTGPREVELLPPTTTTTREQQRRGRRGGGHRPSPLPSSSSSSASSSSSSSRLLFLRARRLARGDLGRTPWLDGQSLEAAARELSGKGGAAEALAAEAAAALAAADASSPPPSPSFGLPAPPPPRLSISLPSFGRPVLFDDPVRAAAAAAGTAAAAAAASSRAETLSSAAAEGALSRAAAADAVAPSSLPEQQQQQRRRPRLLRPLFDPEAGLESPAELKASLLANGGGGGGRRTVGGGDRSARPDAAEAAALDALLWRPPGRPLSAADRALLWRFRWHLAASASCSSATSGHGFSPASPHAGTALALVLRAASGMPGGGRGAGGGGGKQGGGGGDSEVSQLIAASRAASAAAAAPAGRADSGHSPSSSSSPPAGASSRSSSGGGGRGGRGSSSGHGGHCGSNLVQAALPLLGPELAALPAARERAAELLARAPEEELELWLLFLVQALRFERGGGGSGGGAEGGGGGGKGRGKSGEKDEATAGGPLADVLVSRAVASPRLALALHWHLAVEFGDPAFGARAAALHSRLRAELEAKAAEEAGRGEESGGSPAAARRAAAALSAMDEQDAFVGRVRELAEALSTTRTAAAKGEKLRAAMQSKAAKAAAGGGKAAGGGAAPSFVDGLVVATAAAASSSPPRVLLSPVHPSVALVRVAPERCAAFRSAMAPLLLSFDAVSVPEEEGGDGAGGLVAAPAAVAAAREALAAPPPPQQQRRGGSGEGGGSGGLLHLPRPRSGHPNPPPIPPRLRRADLIFKRGDDLRQDALVIALLRVADAALKREGLDLRLTPYSVLPTGAASGATPADGFIEMVRDAPALSAVLEKHKRVSSYLRSVAPSPGSPGGISPLVLDNYTRSLAGWAALTYALGVGDRHFDNVLIANDGRVCHIDFGYILGRDPRPWGAPPLRLAKELLEPLGWGGGGGGGGGVVATLGGGGGEGAPAAAAAAASEGGGAGAPSSLQQQQQQAAAAPPPQLQPSSEAYDRFLALACEAFGVLRSAAAAPSLAAALHLASRCAAPDIARAPAAAVDFVSGRLRPGDRDGEGAARALADAIAEGAAALLPAVLETTHKWAQSFR